MYTDLKEVLTNEKFDRETNLLRLTGWRDEEVTQAAEAGWLIRLAPAVCALGAAVGVWFQSPGVLAFFALTAIVGVFAPNHPVEVVANAVAVRFGRTPQPPSRAGRRLGCLMGTVMLGGAAIAYAAGAPVLGASLALPLSVVATFVATTNICVPSMILTLLAGSQSCTRPQLVSIPGRRQAVTESR